MCIALPMQVLSVEPGHARVAGRGEERVVSTALVGEVHPGDWLLVFLDSARTRIDAQHAAEVNATLDLLAAALHQGGGAHADAAFTLPSSMSAGEFAALVATPTGARA